MVPSVEQILGQEWSRNRSLHAARSPADERQLILSTPEIMGCIDPTGQVQTPVEIGHSIRLRSDNFVSKY